MSHVRTASTTAFLPQVYRNTRTATRKRRAAPQLASKMLTQVMSYVPEQCPFITDNAKRCSASFKYRNQLNQQPMDCSSYCLSNSAVWLSSLLQDLAQEEYISFTIPILNRKYRSEYILHPIQFTVTDIDSKTNPLFNLDRTTTIPLDLETTTNEIDEYVANLSHHIKELEVAIPIHFSEYQYEEDDETQNDGERDQDEYLHDIIEEESVIVEITDSFFTTSIFRHFDWDGRFSSYKSGSEFVLRGIYGSERHHLTPAFTPASL